MPWARDRFGRSTGRDGRAVRPGFLLAGAAGVLLVILTGCNKPTPPSVNGQQATGLSQQGAAASDPSTPNSGPVTTSSDMRGYNGDLDVDALNAKLAAKGSALAGDAGQIDAVARQYNLDPAIFASLIMEESGWGTNRATSQYNDCTSVMTGPDASQFRSFASDQAAMQYTANSLANGGLYFSQGNTTLGAVGAIYAPSGASNDPNGTNGGWASDIATIANTQMPRKPPTGGS